MTRNEPFTASNCFGQPVLSEHEKKAKCYLQNDKYILTYDKPLNYANCIHFMKRGSTIFLQAVTVIVGIGTLALMLWEPHLEGRNAHATLFQIYFNDPFLAYVYIGSLAFFAALYQAFTLLGLIRRNEIFSPRSVSALRIIKYCALTLITFLLGAEAYFSIVQRAKGEDIAGGVAMGLLLIFISAIIAAAAGVFQKTLQSAVDMKSENDLTV
jgi:hypothetical protein